MKALDPFSMEGRIVRLEGQMKELIERVERIEMFIGIGEGYYSESSLDSRIDRLEDWRRDNDT